MFAWQATVQDESGNVVPLPVVTVYESDGETLASIYSEGGGALPNPLTGTMEGFVQFWAEPGRYKIVGANGGQTQEWEVEGGGLEVAELASVAFETRQEMVDALPDIEPLGAGRVIYAGGVAYERDPLSSAISDMPGWKPSGDITPEHFGAVGDGIADDAPAFREAVAFLAARGGGELHLGEKTYNLATTAAFTRYNDGDTHSAQYPVCLPSGVSLVGVPSETKLIRQETGAEAVIGLLDWGRARITGIEIEGPGATGNATHGVFFAVTNQSHVCDDFILADLNIHDVGSYGVGYQYGLPRRGVLRDIRTADTGSDGIDWKVRGVSVAATFAEGVVFDNIEVRRFGKRITGGSATGFGIRGPVQANNLRVYEIGAGQTGIAFQPGQSSPATSTNNIPSSRSTLTNWYAEGSRGLQGGDAAYGLVVWAAGSIQIGHGIARWCRVHTRPETVTPFGTLHGPRIAATVIPVVNDSGPVLLQLPGASVDVDVQSDYDLFSTKAGTAVAGQTVFNAPTGYGQFVKVVRGQTTLVAGTDYTVAGDTVTTASPLPAGEALFLVYPPLRAVRVEADYQRISGHSDRWCPTSVSFASWSNTQTSSRLGFVADGDPTRLTMLNDPLIPGLMMGALSGDSPLRIVAAGAGQVEVNRARLLNVPTSATGMPGTVWNDAGTLKIVP